MASFTVHSLVFLKKKSSLIGCVAPWHVTCRRRCRRSRNPCQPLRPPYAPSATTSCAIYSSASPPYLLVRAALTCHSSLRAVRSSPTFRRRFRELHSPPLLGIFLDIFESDTPAFRPLRPRSDPGLTAAICGSDFFLTRLPGGDKGSAPEWLIRDCHDGYVVLLSCNSDHIDVYNPLIRALHLFPKPPEEICEDMRVEFHVLSPEEDQGPFRVICVCHEDYGAQAAVLSSETREWQTFPWADAASMQPEDEKYSPDNGKLVNGFIFWIAESLASARVLNTATLQFSRIDLPHIQGEEALTSGETRDGKLCIVCTVKLTLVVWFRGTDDDGFERWMLDKIFPLEQEIDGLRLHCFMGDHVILKVLAIENGFVYLSAYREVDPKLPGWFLSFCLETAKLNKLCPILHADDMYPYIMAWPPLVLNKPSSSS